MLGVFFVFSGSFWMVMASMATPSFFISWTYLTR